jgi:hypothetical protein
MFNRSKRIIVAAIGALILVAGGGWLIHDDLAQRDALALSFSSRLMLRAPGPRSSSTDFLLVSTRARTADEVAACRHSSEFPPPAFMPVHEWWTAYPSQRTTYNDLCVHRVPVIVSYDTAGDLVVTEDARLSFAGHFGPKLESLVTK